MAVAGTSSTTASAVALASAFVVLVTAVVNAVVALRTARQGDETRKAVLSSAETSDEVLSNVAASFVDLSKGIDQRFTTSQAQMTTLLDVLRDLVNRLYPDAGGS
jgi:hypothetical protein